MRERPFVTLPPGTRRSRPPLQRAEAASRLAQRGVVALQRHRPESSAVFGRIAGKNAAVWIKG
jgi:hypothetical protein